MDIDTTTSSKTNHFTLLPGGRKATKFLSAHEALEVELRSRLTLYSEKIKQADRILATLRNERKKIREKLRDLRWEKRWGN
jgi:hypothetical protein